MLNVIDGPALCVTVIVLVTPKDSLLTVIVPSLISAEGLLETEIVMVPFPDPPDKLDVSHVALLLTVHLPVEVIVMVLDEAE